MKKLTLITILLTLLFTSSLYCQFYTLYNYNDDYNITSNLTKTITVDNKGFIWVGTDAGLSRFDGKNFINIIDNFPSYYVKDVKATYDNKIIVVTDLGIGYIEGKGNEYRYKPIINSGKNNKLYYPKDIFIDSKNNLWIGESDGIGKIKHGVYKKYSFPSKYATDDYQHGFLIVEDNYGNIYASSWKGYFFKYEPTKDEFIELKILNNKKQLFINQLRWYNNSLLAATNIGLIQFYIKSNNVVEMQPLVNLFNCMCYEIDKSNKIYIGTNDSGLYLWDINNKSLIKMTEFYEDKVVNDLFIDQTDNIWICSDDGIYLLRKSFFSKFLFSNITFDRNNYYIKTLQSDVNGDIYFSDQENIYKVTDYKAKKYFKVYESKTKRVYSFAVKNGVIWVSTRDYSLIRIDKKSVEVVHKEIKGRLTSLFIDSQNNLWGFEENYGTVIKIDPDNKLTKYSIVPQNITDPVIKEYNNKVYFVCNQNKISLFFYDTTKDKFIKESSKLDKKYNSEFVINDFGLDEHGKIALMTNNGLFILNNGIISEVSKPLKGVPFNVKAIAEVANKKIWIGTEHGLILKDHEEFITFTKNDGLPNNVITPRGLAIDKNGHVWVATSSGLAYWQNNDIVIHKTPTPIIISVQKKNKELLNETNLVSIKGKSDLRIQYAALVYPNKVQYKFKLVGVNDNWSEITNIETQVFNNLGEGEYVFQVTAQQSGYLWSEVSEVVISIYPPWYSSIWMIIIYVLLAVVFIVYLTMFIQKRRIVRLENHKKKLVKLVEEKIVDLKKEKEITEKLLSETELNNKKLAVMNNELVKANEFKSDILSIAAHDLKNPLSTILNILQLIKDENYENKDLLEMIEIIDSSALRMMSLIGELLESIIVENTKFKLTITEFSLSELVKRIVMENQIKAAKKNQAIECNCFKDVKIEADHKWVSEILDNVINNAVKYSPKDKRIIVEISELNDKVQIKIKDEGPGFTKEDKEKIFNKFQKLSARPTGGESSTGLGLAIVKELVNLHNGSIRVESEEGKGACFYIELYKKLELN